MTLLTIAFILYAKKHFTNRVNNEISGIVQQHVGDYIKLKDKDIEKR